MLLSRMTCDDPSLKYAVPTMWSFPDDPLRTDVNPTVSAEDPVFVPIQVLELAPAAEEVQ